MIIVFCNRKISMEQLKIQIIKTIYIQTKQSCTSLDGGKNQIYLCFRNY
ncbi:hypothetical protein pb186bvf_015163 [Paramecium bursaria]